MAAAAPTTRASTRSICRRWRRCWRNAAGRLGFNLKLVLETCEERGSIGLREFVAAHRGIARGRCADRQRRPARDAGGADDRHRHARHLPFRSRRRSAAGRRAFRPLGRADHRPGGGADARHRHDHRPQRQDPGARLAAAQRRAGERAVRAGRLPGRRRRRGRHDRRELGRAGPDGGGEDLRLEQLYCAGDAVRPAGESGQRGGAERPRALPDPLHRGHRSRHLRARFARPPRRGGLSRGAHRERRRPHAGEPHRSRGSLGALDASPAWSTRWASACR